MEKESIKSGMNDRNGRDFYAQIRDRLMTKTKEELVEHIIMGIHFSMQEMLSGHNKEACRVQDAMSRMMKQGQE